MPAGALKDLSRCAIHSITHKPWSLEQCCDAYAAAGIGGISIWRETIAGMDVGRAARIVAAAGLKVPALVRGGFFPARQAEQRVRILDENKQCVDQAAALNAEMVVLVVGAVPGMPLSEARRQVADGIGDLLPYAEMAGVKLAIEPLHPMYAADRSCINRMAEARAICEQLQHPLLGIAVDVYHVWWDPDLEAEIAAAGRQNRLFGFHVCDWRVATRDLLNDRAIMGAGCIDIRTIRGWVEAAGFEGFNEVEIFSDEHWAEDPSAYLQKIIHGYLNAT